MLSLPEEEGDGGDFNQSQSVMKEVSEIVLRSQAVPHDLSAEHFFETLLREALDHMPIAAYAELRRRGREIQSS